MGKSNAVIHPCVCPYVPYSRCCVLGYIIGYNGTLMGNPMLEVEPTVYSMTGSGRNDNEAIAGADSEAFGRFMHHRQFASCVFVCVYDIPRRTAKSAINGNFGKVKIRSWFLRNSKYRCLRPLFLLLIYDVVCVMCICLQTKVENV